MPSGLFVGAGVGFGIVGAKGDGIALAGAGPLTGTGCASVICRVVTAINTAATIAIVARADARDFLPGLGWTAAGGFPEFDLTCTIDWKAGLAGVFIGFSLRTGNFIGRVVKFITGSAVSCPPWESQVKAFSKSSKVSTFQPRSLATNENSRAR
jgi:hypothetical protein